MPTEFAGIRKYTIGELRAIMREDPYAVRDEVLRRHSILAKRFAPLKKEIEALEALYREVLSL